MKNLAQADPAPLSWVRLRLRRSLYALHQGGDVYASLQWGRTLTGATADGEWTLVARDGSDREIEISSVGSSLVDAVYEAGKRGRGSLTVVNGNRYEWTARRWRTRAKWSTSDGVDDLRFRGRTVTIESPATRPADLSVLILVAQYLNAQDYWDRITRIVTAALEVTPWP